MWIIPCTISLALYWQAIHFGFVWDDFHLVDDLLPYYTDFKDAFTKQGIFGLPIYYYRPFFFLAFMFERWLWGVGPDAFHTSMVVTNVLVTFFAYWIPLKILSGEENAPWAALICASLFAAHPIHTEVVAWISGRPDGFLALFIFASFFGYLQYRTFPHKKRWIFLSLASWFLALLNKETAVTFFFCLLLFDFLFPWEESRPLSRQERKQMKRKKISFYPHQIWFGLILLVYFGLRHHYLSKIQIPSATQFGFFESIRREALVLGLYLWKMIYPAELNAFIGEIPGELWLAALSVAFLAIFAWAAHQSLRKQRLRLTFFCLFFFLAALAPGLSLAILPVAKTVAAERYLYLPSFGLCFLAGLFFIRWPAREAWRGSKILVGAKTLLFLGILAPLTYKTILQIPVWKNEFAFWENMVRNNPDQGLPYQNLGGAYQRNGKEEEAIGYYKKALEVPNTTEGRSVALNAMGVIYFGRKDYDTAENYFKRAIQERPTYVHPYCNLGSIYFWKADNAKGDKKAFLTEAVGNLEHCVKRSSDPEKWKERLEAAKEELKKL